MKTPIVDFVKAYGEQGFLRCHMPGHKGVSLLGCESLDITEFDGADCLYEASGIIRESEKNASALFGCETYYSTEGSSQCIRAMLALVRRYAACVGKAPRLVAGRNAHKVFVSAAALLDMEVEWLYGGDSYLSCALDAAAVEEAIVRVDPVAVYVTSPDYLGKITDIAALAAVCRKHGVLLLVDNAHGAYLKFLTPSRHPMDLGADLCCDSAHKTLPALTGGAYLHIGDTAPSGMKSQAKQALELFGSTSPSYLILQSLDRVNAVLADGYRETLAAFIERVAALRMALTTRGYTLLGDEPIKLTVAAKSYGYSGNELATALKERGLVVEFYDPDHVVLMLTPENGDLERIQQVLLAVPRREVQHDCPPRICHPERVMAASEVLFCESETIPTCKAAGRILSDVTVGCPPAVPIVMCGERIDAAAVDAFAYYGIAQCTVVKDGM